MSSFLNKLGDIFVPNEIAPYLGMLAPMVAPQLGIVGSMALSQLGSIKQYDGALDPYSAIATGIALSTPQARAIRRAGRIDPTRGTVGQRLSAGIAQSLPKNNQGMMTGFSRALDPRFSVLENKYGNYVENPFLASKNVPPQFLQTNPFDKTNLNAQGNLVDDLRMQKALSKTYDMTYGEKAILGEDFVKGQEGTRDTETIKTITDAEGNVTTENILTKGQPGIDAAFGTDTNLTKPQQEEYLRLLTEEGSDSASEFLKNLPRVGGEQSLLSKAGDIGSQVAGAIMPGFSDYDPLTGQFKEFNFEKALLTVGVATTLGGLKAIAEKIKKEKNMSEAEEKAIWKEWFDSYERRAGKPYSETNYPDDFLMEKYDRYMLASGGRVGYNMGGLSGGIMASSGVPQGMQVDGRNGTFIPMGVQEKADDVPAMLSKNEFVMTADAVKAAGDGDANKGAQRMYDLMHSLEAQV